MARKLNLPALGKHASYGVMLTAVTLGTWAVKGVRFMQVASAARKKEQHLRHVVTSAIDTATAELGPVAGAAYVVTHAAQAVHPNQAPVTTAALGAAAVITAKNTARNTAKNHRALG